MPRFRLTVAYDGTNFHGWQRQEPPEKPPLRTVQGVLEAAVKEALRRPVDVTGASRTDAGVHAVGQVAAFTAETTIPVEKLPAAISARLPDDVQVRSVRVVGDDFDPISHCTRKMYRFSIAHGGERGLPSPPPLFDRHVLYYTYHCLDAARMHATASHLVGRRDFASFAQISHGRESTVRTVFDCRAYATAPDRCHIDIIGDGFLYNMVRIVAGTLVEVGRGRWEPDRVCEILSACDRRAAGPTLPPSGLCLRWIEYPSDPPRDRDD